MVDVTPDRPKIVIRIPKEQISFLAGKTKYSYDEIKDKVQEYLEYLKENITSDLKVWIDLHVPKRTGQLRHFLKLWLDGSNIYKNVLRIIFGTYLPYADAVEQMTTGMVRHSGQKGYVYYSNIFQIRGPVTLDDPQAVGHYFSMLIEYAEERAQYWISQGKAMMWS